VGDEMKEEEDEDILFCIGTGDIEIFKEGTVFIMFGLKLLHSNLSELTFESRPAEFSKLRNKFGERRSSGLKSFEASFSFIND
jgi:hypothetical protein